MATKQNLSSFDPVGSKLLVEPDFAKNLSILIPDSVKNPNIAPFGTVIKVGPGRQLEHGAFELMPFIPGDRIMVHAWQGVPIEVMGKAYICIDVNFIIGKIKDYALTN